MPGPRDLLPSPAERERLHAEAQAAIARLRAERARRRGPRLSPADQPTSVSFRELARHPSRVVAACQGRPVVVTRRGWPVAVLTPIDHPAALRVWLVEQGLAGDGLVADDDLDDAEG